MEVGPRPFVRVELCDKRVVRSRMSRDQVVVRPCRAAQNGARRMTWCQRSPGCGLTALSLPSCCRSDVIVLVRLIDLELDKCEEFG